MTRAEICNVPCGMAVVPVIQAWRYAFARNGRVASGNTRKRLCPPWKPCVSINGGALALGLMMSLVTTLCRQGREETAP